LCYKENNVEPDHDLDCDGSCAVLSANAACCANMHSLQRADSKGVSAWLLRKQDLLRYIAKEHSSSIATTREERFSARVECDMRHDHPGDHSKSSVRRSAICFD
jgi:hypothetical protein